MKSISSQEMTCKLQMKEEKDEQACDSRTSLLFSPAKEPIDAGNILVFQVIFSSFNLRLTLLQMKSVSTSRRSVSTSIAGT